MSRSSSSEKSTEAMRAELRLAGAIIVELEEAAAADDAEEYEAGPGCAAAAAVAEVTFTGPEPVLPSLLSRSSNFGDSGITGPLAVDDEEAASPDFAGTAPPDVAVEVGCRGTKRGAAAAGAAVVEVDVVDEAAEAGCCSFFLAAAAATAACSCSSSLSSRALSMASLQPPPPLPPEALFGCCIVAEPVRRCRRWQE